ncbi:Hypoxia-inducible factor 1-alpha inhibitor [Seminavis robusta]|uniref:Hypoxia-inducible factor 1-alpha inhibitor n=1 Tax=Seminavis robusta TaxID=568900 RepID=A0A9N8HSN6_9STRA|nr:Hypoxia-inducible factor 1-alpha inhibitor [Seminavis robusta]|eukprot:Sro1545_g281310.1 Hypoxia-inducible factor 1-alpha inhibitor (457) ;mRNA; r:13094-14801
MTVLSSKTIEGSLVFKSLLFLSSMLFMVSLVLYSGLQRIDDDDIVSSETRIKSPYWSEKEIQKPTTKGKTTPWSDHSGKQKRIRNRQQTRDKRMEAIQQFGAHREEEKRTRIKEGIVSVREQFEQKHPWSDKARVRQAVFDQRIPNLLTTYDVYDCPDLPPPSYPFTWNLMEILENWNAGNTTLPSRIFQALCVFDWETEEHKARNYQQQDLPFVVQNFPEAMRATERWSTPGYMEELLTRNSASQQQATTRTRTSDELTPLYTRWLKAATELGQRQPHNGEDEKPWYFRLSAMLEETAYLYEELPFFDPSLGETFTMLSPKEHRGINCRFGMKGIAAESHFDGHNNFIVVMGGMRRYILAHPDQCNNMELHPKGKPNSRHSKVDWTRIHLEAKASSEKRPITRVQANEIILKAGDMLYLPTYWFHYIVSLDTSYQCNSRSGISTENKHHIVDCGF